MIENVKKVTNPLTIIAIFASLCEVASTLVLIYLPKPMQKIYIWFCIGFPSALLLFFFLTLWIKNILLYAPTDYRNDDSFFLANKISEIKKQETERILEDKSSQDNKENQEKIKKETNNKIDYILAMNLAPYEKEVFDIIRNSKSISSNDLTGKVSFKSAVILTKALNSLKAKGLIIRVGSTKQSEYIINI